MGYFYFSEFNNTNVNGREDDWNLKWHSMYCYNWITIIAFSWLIVYNSCWMCACVPSVFFSAHYKTPAFPKENSWGTGSVRVLVWKMKLTNQVQIPTETVFTLYSKAFGKGMKPSLHLLIGKIVRLTGLSRKTLNSNPLLTCYKLAWPLIPHVFSE